MQTTHFCTIGYQPFFCFAVTWYTLIRQFNTALIYFWKDYELDIERAVFNKQVFAILRKPGHFQGNVSVSSWVSHCFSKKNTASMLQVSKGTLKTQLNKQKPPGWEKNPNDYLRCDIWGNLKIKWWRQQFLFNIRKKAWVHFFFCFKNHRCFPGTILCSISDAH